MNKLYCQILGILFILILPKTFANEQNISLEKAVRMCLANNKKFLLEQKAKVSSAQNSYLNIKRGYSHPSIDSSLSISEEIKADVDAEQKFLIGKTGGVISLKNSYNLTDDGEQTEGEMTYSLNLSQPLSPKEILANRRILRDANNDYNLSLRSLESAKDGFIMQIIQGYVALIKQEKSIELIQKKIDEQEKLLLIAELRYKNGEISKVDYIDLELQNKLDRFNILAEEENLRKAKEEFLRLLGTEEDMEFTIISEIKPFFEILPPINESIDRATKYQLMEAELSLFRKESDLKEAKLSKNLSFFLEVSHSSQIPLFSSRVKDDEDKLGIKAEYKLYDRGAYKRNLKIQQEELEMERNNLKELQKKIERQMREIYKEADLIKVKKELLSEMEKASTSLLEAGKLKFKMGAISQSELNNIIERYNKVLGEMVGIEIENLLIGMRLLSLQGELTSFYEVCQK
jgi:outer membrane protein TolC